MQNLNIWVMSAFVFIVSMVIFSTEARKDERDCEVCISVLERFLKSESDAVTRDPKKAEVAFKKFCKGVPRGGKENRFCYFIGGTEDAATGLLKKITEPFKFFKPPNKICEELKKADSQICELRFDKKADFTKLDKLRVGELKKILSNWGEDSACKGCAEKSDFVKKILELLPKYDPEEHKKLQAAKSEL